MKNPTKAQVQTVIDNLSKMLKKANKEKSLDMRETNLCGTVHCHAGWYVLGKYPKMPKKQKESNNYIVGARVMALDLGAFSEHELQDWAYHNPKIWGNGNGSNMFCSELAFIHPEKRPDGANKLSDIIDHWTEVRDRLSK